jgi:hypothetical protein
MVFRYPLNQSKHFIKRVGGVGGDWIKIVRGDIWVRRGDDETYRIATKRRRVRDELYLPVYPPGGDSPWKKPADEYWDGGDGWSVPDAKDFGRLAFAGGEAATITFQKRIGDTTSDTSTRLMAEGDLVRDARFQMRVLAEEAASITLRWATAEDRDVAFRLAIGSTEGGSAVSARDPDREEVRELDLALVPGTPIDVELEVVDGHVYAHVDGKERVVIDRQLTLDDGRRLEDFDQRFEIEAAGGPIVITDIRVQRDVEYTRREMTELTADGPGLQVPEGHFFMLGDNTRHSSDSRAWELEVVVLEDGSEILYESNDSDNRPRYDDDGWLTVVDREGVQRRWRDEDEADGGRSEPDRPAPFVPRRLVVGRAYFVFWPMHVPGRAGFIH